VKIVYFPEPPRRNELIDFRLHSIIWTDLQGAIFAQTVSTRTCVKDALTLSIMWGNRV
jgi:hypothetical protein